MSHGQEGDRETTSKEQDEVDSQLVSARRRQLIDGTINVNNVTYY